MVTPKLKRSALEITAGSQPIARSTGEGSLEPLAHAEPVEQATPAWSRAMKSAWRSRPTKAMFEVCRKAVGARADDLDRQSDAAGERSRFEVGREASAHARGHSLRFVMPQFERAAHADGERDGFGAGANAGLLEAAEELRVKFDVVAHDERADAERAAEFVGGDGHRGDAELAEVDRQFAGDLGGVGVERDVVLVANRGEFGDRLDDAGFVVGEHGGDEAGFGAQQSRQVDRRE